MTKFSCAFLLLATVVADLAADVLTLMGSQATAIQGVLEKDEADIVADDFKPLFADAGDASAELKAAGKIKDGDDGAIDYEGMATAFKGIRNDPTTINEDAAKALIKTVQKEEADPKSTIADMATKMKEISDMAVAAIAAAAPADGGEMGEMGEKKGDTEDEPTVAPETADATTVAADVDGEGDEEEEEDEEDGADEQSASFNFALSSALLSIVV